MISNYWDSKKNQSKTRLPKNADIHALVSWCIKNISPQEYYIYSGFIPKVGGTGWEITKEDLYYYLYLLDEKMLTFALLTIK